MANEPEEVLTEPEVDEEDGGGPVKTFLEHLEDLRWTLIKSVSSILISMIICLIAGNRLVAFLTWPLNCAMRQAPRTNQTVTVRLDTNVVGQFPREMLTNMGVGANVAGLKLVPSPAPIGSNLWMLALQPDPQAKPIDTGAIAVTLKNYSPIGAFVVALKLALYGGAVLSAPFVLYFVGAFVLPALKVREKDFLYKAVGLGSLLFLLGIAFCYFIIMQVALMATVSFSQWMGFGADEWRAEDYISFVCKFMLGMGLSFQLPVVILTMVKIGLLDYPKLTKFRSYWVVINMVISAVATPSGDPFTMCLMAIPLQVLYEISVLVAWMWYRRDQKEARAEA